MKRSSTLYALLGILCLVPSAGAQATRHIGLQRQAGSVEFLAVGWPSALKIHGKGCGPEGDLVVVGSVLSGSIGFDLETLETGIGLRDRHMKELYLQTVSYPRATLKLSPLELGRLAESAASESVSLPFQGLLTLHGVERPVAGEARVTRAGPRVTTAATFAIDIRDFGIAVPSYLGITVAEKVQVKAGFDTLVDSKHETASR